MIEPLKSEHVKAVSQLHCDSLTGLLRDLGPGATSAFYYGATRSSTAIGLVNTEQGQTTGFVLGSANPGRMRREIFTCSFFRTLSGTLSGVLRKPGTARWLISSLFGSKNKYDTKSAELVYLTVDPSRRSAGTGQTLVEYFEKKLNGLDIRAYELSVDSGNEKAIDFYERLGFEAVSRYTEFGIEHVRYKKELG